MAQPFIAQTFEASISLGMKINLDCFQLICLCLCLYQLLLYDQDVA